jgi:hypothetical protein
MMKILLLHGQTDLFGGLGMLRWMDLGCVSLYFADNIEEFIASFDDLAVIYWGSIVTVIRFT